MLDDFVLQPASPASFTLIFVCRQGSGPLRTPLLTGLGASCVILRAISQDCLVPGVLSPQGWSRAQFLLACFHILE